MIRRLRPLFEALRRRLRLLLLCGVLLVLAGCLAGWVLWPQYHLRAAESALAQGDAPGARRHLDAARALGWDSGRLHLLAARAERLAGRYDEAEHELSACQQRQGADDAVTLERALLRAQRGDQTVNDYLMAQVKRGDPEALPILKVLIQQHLDNYDLYDARDCLDLYLERKPDDVQALMGRGFIWDRLLLYADAVRDYRRAVEVAPENDQARQRLAETLLITGPAREARLHFEALHSRHPDDPAVRVGLARAWRLEGEPDKAPPLLDALLTEQPRHPGALTERGLVALDQGHPVEAEKWLRDAVIAAPSDRQAVYNLYQCLRRSGKPDEIEEYRARLQTLDDDLKRLGELTKAVLKTPGDPALRCEAAAIFLRHGEKQEGERWLAAVLRLDPHYRPAHQALADYYEHDGQPENAAHHRRLAQEGSPPGPTAISPAPGTAGRP